MKSLAVLFAATVVASSAFAGKTSTATLDVSNMTCSACPITVRKALEKVPGVDSAKIDLKTHRAVVAFDPAKTTPELLTKATTDAGFPSSIKQLQ